MPIEYKIYGAPSSRNQQPLMDSSRTTSTETQPTQILIGPAPVIPLTNPPVTPSSSESDGHDDNDPPLFLTVPSVTPPSSESEARDDGDPGIPRITSPLSLPWILGEHGFNVDLTPPLPTIAVEKITKGLSQNGCKYWISIIDIWNRSRSRRRAHG